VESLFFNQMNKHGRFGIVLIAFGVISLLYERPIYYVLSSSTFDSFAVYLGFNLIKALSVLLLISGAGVFLYSYLAPDRKKPDHLSSDGFDLESSSKIQDLENRIRSIELTEKDGSSSVDNENHSTRKIDEQKVVELLKSHVDKSLIKNVEESLTEKIQNHSFIRRVRDINFDVNSRVSDQIFSLNKRGNINLIIGVMTTIAAIFVLFFMLSFDKENVKTWPDLASHYIPRLSIAIFIEIFAFFFLRLYRQGLEEVKYYQNQLTIIQSKQAAFEAAYAIGSDEAKSLVVAEFCRLDTSNPDEEKILENLSNPKDAAELIERISKVIASHKK